MTALNRMTKAFAALACALVLALFAAGAAAQSAFADTTAIYTVPATSSLYNPVTNEIEDTGGASNEALGESMVEGVAYDNVLVEIDADGLTWVTFRLKLADQLGEVSVEADTDGDGEFASTEATEMQTAVENEGEDTEVQLIDYRVQVSSTDSNLRVTMYVDPMGRDVIFFMTLDFDGAVEGNTDAIAFVESVVAGEEIAEADAKVEVEEVEEVEVIDEEADEEEADDAEDAEAEEEEAAEDEEEGSGVPVLPIVIVVLVVLIAVLLWYFLAYKPKHDASKNAATAAATGTAAAAAAAAAAGTEKVHPALRQKVEQEAADDVATTAALDDVATTEALDGEGKDA